MSSPFADVVAPALDTLLQADPVEATVLGDHRFDHELADPSPAAAAAHAGALRRMLEQLDEVAPADIDERVDAEVLRTTVRSALFGIEQLREPEWNPMEHNPGGALYALASRPFAPAADRLESARARLAAVPGYLAAARQRLRTMSRVHAQTAIKQLAGTSALIGEALPELAAEAGAALGDEAQAARRAVDEHAGWLRDRLDSATRDPRIGTDLFRAKLALTLDTDFEPDDLLARAEDDFARITGEIVAEAGRFAATADPGADTVRQVLAELAQDAATDDTVLDLCRSALEQATDFVRRERLMTVYDDPIEVIEMPEIDRGIAGAYCEWSGPLEAEALPTKFAVSPTPEGWSEERIASYYREYNVHMLHDLTIHEAMPGHALQGMHSNRHKASTPIRAVFGSGSFVEGWAVYAEQLMARHGYLRSESERAASALRLQQLKMQLRTTLNTILDIRFHCRDLDEQTAMRMMTEQAFQEDGEAAEKWQRVQLTATQLCTYYVGYCEVRDLARDLRAERADWTEAQLHDAIIGHGSPPVRHLRTLLLAG